MVSGVKTKKKGKLVLAKDKKQAVIAITIIAIFVLNGIFLIAKSIMANMPQSASPQQASQAVNGTMPPPGANKVSTAPGAPMETAKTAQNETLPPGAQNSMNTMEAPQAASSAPASNPLGFLNVLIPIVLLLILGIIILIASKVYKQKKMPAKGSKGQLPFAENKKQALTAIILISIFVLNGIYMIANSILSNMPQPAPTQQASHATGETMPPPGANKVSTAPGAPMETAKTAQNETLPPGAQNSMNTMEAPQAASSAPASNPLEILNIIIPIVLLLILGLVLFIANKTYKQKKMPKEGSKKALPFAENKNQAMAAVVLITIFVLNGVYMLFRNVMNNMPQPAPVTANNQTPPMPGAQSQNAMQPVNPEQTPATAQSPIAPGVQPQVTPQQPNQTVQISGSGAENESIDIIAKNSANGRMGRGRGRVVTIAVTSSGRSNPFLPAAEAGNSGKVKKLPFLTAPPEYVPKDPSAGKIMNTTVSGILFDKYNPSAILNISGTDYLVKKGDIINDCRVLSISKTQVTVKMGSNLYKAGVGQLLSQSDLNVSSVANLNRKFGGNNKH